MIYSSDCYAIVEKILKDLNISWDAYTTWTYEDMKAFADQYLRDDDYIKALVDIELANYDTSDMHYTDIEDVHSIISDEVWDRLDSLRENYYALQEKIQDDAYTSIIQTLRNADLTNVVDVDVEVEPSDPSVGIFDEERTIVFTLSNGYTISFEVSFDD